MMELIASLRRDLEVARGYAERLRVENERLRSEARGKWAEILPLWWWRAR